MTFGGYTNVSGGGAGETVVAAINKPDSIDKIIQAICGQSPTALYQGGAGGGGGCTGLYNVSTATGGGGGGGGAVILVYRQKSGSGSVSVAGGTNGGYTNTVSTYSLDGSPGNIYEFNA